MAPTQSEYRLVKQNMSCVQDATAIAALKLGVGDIVSHKQLYSEVPPKKTIGTSIAAIEKAPSAAQALGFIQENYSNSKGGPEYAVVQASRDGAHRLVLATVGGSSHAFYLGERQIIDNKKRGGQFMTCRMQRKDYASVWAARTMVDTFFGHKVRVTAVHRVVLKAAAMKSNVQNIKVNRK